MLGARWVRSGEWRALHGAIETRGVAVITRRSSGDKGTIASAPGSSAGVTQQSRGICFHLLSAREMENLHRRFLPKRPETGSPGMFRLSGAALQPFFPSKPLLPSQFRLSLCSSSSSSRKLVCRAQQLLPGELRAHRCKSEQRSTGNSSLEPKWNWESKHSW